MRDNMQAVLLAGGKGTRLRPYTTILPKPLMPIGDVPILEILIKQLKSAGVDHVILATGYLSHLIEAYFGDGQRFGIKIEYSHEDQPLGTAGPLKLIENLDDIFFVMNGDLLTDLNFSDLYKSHIDEGNHITVSSYTKDVKIDLGVLEIDDNGDIENYIEKPTLHYNVSMGIYVMNKSVLKNIPDGEFYDLPDLIKSLINSKLKVGTYLFEGQWLDIGRPNDYEKAIDLFYAEKEKFV